MSFLPMTRIHLITHALHNALGLRRQFEMLHAYGSSVFLGLLTCVFLGCDLACLVVCPDESSLYLFWLTDRYGQPPICM